jgi:alpha-ribazole phosphatase
MQLYLIRHPEPRDGRGLCYGRLDLGVDPQAIARAAGALRQRLPAWVLQTAPIYTSPLSRCAALAQSLASPRNAIVAAELIEMDFGSWEGRRWDAVPREELDRWAEDVWGYRPGGFESALDVAARWRQWLERIRHEGDAAIAVTHAGVIRVALAQGEARAPIEWAQVEIEFGSHVEVRA